MIVNQRISNQTRSSNEHSFEHPDNLLVKRAQSGDLRAFELLAVQHKQKIFQAIFRIIKNREDAEDQLQETLLRAYCGLHSFRGDSKFTTWLTRIAINQALMCVRRRRYGDISLDHSIDRDSGWLKPDIREWRPNPEQSWAYTEANMILREKLATLPHTLRSAVILKHLRECTSKEVAAELGISTAAVKSRVLRARKRLRFKLGERPDLLAPAPPSKAVEYARNI